MSSIAEVRLGDGTKFRCVVPADLAIHEGDLCVAEVKSVLEFGRILRLKSVEAGGRAENLPLVIRRATLQDKSRDGENALHGRMAVKTCAEKIAAYKLDMTLVSVRYSFDRALVTVTFTAPERVDFRALIRDLAQEFGARIEMRQIGVRDAAGLVGGMGPCGQCMCCCVWLKAFEAVNVRMAKMQMLTLNPNTISGMCGRLKCCLRYEHEHYRELAAEVPREGAAVRCPAGDGRVVERRLLSERVKVRLDDGSKVVECAARDVMETGAPPWGKKDAHEEDTDSERPEPELAGDS